jgi:uncharacterized LabA/DUF88 family protein
MRYACFVDCSNLIGSLNKINLRINDYQCFFRFIVEESYKQVLTAYLNRSPEPEALLSRVYWYAVGHLDQYDFSDPQMKSFFQKIFNDSGEVKRSFMSDVGKSTTGLSPTDRAFESFYEDRKNWYASREKKVEGFCGFYDKVRRESDFIDINDNGHWKLNFIAKDVDEKGIDTSLAVDSVIMIDTYDVALIVSGDADMIPSINYLKRQGKYVGVVSFIKGHPPERKGRQQSTRLSKVADFDVPIYETDLMRLGCAEVFSGE